MAWRHWHALTSVELGTADPASTVALMPWGATEQHGPHLPVGTDTLIADAIAAGALDRVRGPGLVLRLPTLGIGVSTEHESFPGTLSLTPETAIALLTEIGSSVAAVGIRKLVIFNSHGGQTQLVDMAALRLRRERQMMVVRASSFRLGLSEPLRTAIPARERRYGLHGGLVETSLMLAIAPGTVRRGACRTFASTAETVEVKTTVLEVEGQIGIGWCAEDLNPEGATGDARAANETLGQALLDHWTGRLATLLEEVIAVAWPLGKVPS